MPTFEIFISSVKKNAIIFYLCGKAMFFVTSVHQTYAGERKKKRSVERKNELAQRSRPPGRQMTHLAHCVEHGHSFFIFIFRNDKRVKTASNRHSLEV